MKMPPPGERYVAASWIAIGSAVATIGLGTGVVLAFRDRLPARIIVRWEDFQPAATSGVDAVLMWAAILVISVCLVIMGVGFAIHGSVRGSFAAYASGAAVGLGAGIYATVLVQAGEDAGVAPIGMVLGMNAGLVAGWLLARWLRAWPPNRDEPLDVPRVGLEVPASARLAWAAEMRMCRSARLTGAVIPALPATAWLLWVDAAAGAFACALVASVVSARLWATRPHQLAIDYSGIGLRGAGASAPGPIKMADIRAAEGSRVSALRDFGGWGRQWSARGAEGWITRSGEALVVHRHGKPDFVYTVDNAEEAAAVLNTLVARYQSRDQTLTA